MMKNKRGFTLIELLAVIVVLAIILTIATTSVIKNINDSKEKAKYIAAKDIVTIAEAYFVVNGSETSVTIEGLSDYLEQDVTNPKNGENDLFDIGLNQVICRNITQKDIDNGYAELDEIRTYNGQTSKKATEDSNGKPIGYEFDGYWYGFDGNCK